MSAPFGVVRSKTVPLLRDDVDTDQIIPARYLKTVDRSGLAAGLFADWRHDPAGMPREGFVLNEPAMAGREILLGGANFGCGSSREHAAWALRGAGFRAVIASSFADIFRNNALKNGLLPVELGADRFALVAAALAAAPDAELTVDLDAEELTLADGSRIPFRVDPFARQLLLSGADELGYLLSLSERIGAWEASHPSAISTLTPT